MRDRIDSQKLESGAFATSMSRDRVAIRQTTIALKKSRSRRFVLTGKYEDLCEAKKTQQSFRQRNLWETERNELDSAQRRRKRCHSARRVWRTIVDATIFCDNDIIVLVVGAYGSTVARSSRSGERDSVLFRFLVSHWPQKDLYTTFLLVLGFCLLTDVGVLLCAAFFVILALLFVPMCLGAHFINLSLLRVNWASSTRLLIVGQCRLFS